VHDALWLRVPLDDVVTNGADANANSNQRININNNNNNSNVNRRRRRQSMPPPLAPRERWLLPFVRNELKFSTYKKKKKKKKKKGKSIFFDS
jgi:hypothetical protein